jgi:hypothetical protein
MRVAYAKLFQVLDLFQQERTCVEIDLPPLSISIHTQKMLA